MMQGGTDVPCRRHTRVPPYTMMRNHLFGTSGCPILERRPSAAATWPTLNRNLALHTPSLLRLDVSRHAKQAARVGGIHF